MELKEKLRAYSKVSPSGCWEWQRSKDSRGYGKCNVGGGKWERAHRVSYTVFKGVIPNGYVVRHTCDNTSCCNPEHLITGTMADNMRDCVERGRRPRGANHHAAKLTNSDVLYIITSNATAKELSERFSVVTQTIYRIRKDGEKWLDMQEKESERSEHTAQA